MTLLAYFGVKTVSGQVSHRVMTSSYKAYGAYSALTRHRQGYFRTHDRLWGSDSTPPPAISRTNGRIEPHEAALERSQDIPNAYLKL